MAPYVKLNELAIFLFIFLCQLQNCCALEDALITTSIKINIYTHEEVKTGDTIKVHIKIH
jgi:hypothetical protein